jgi:hypothetical protein
MSEEVAVSRAVVKSSKTYRNSTWDLVDAENEEDFSYSKIDKQKLSKDLQNKSTAELKKYVEKQSLKRKEIQAEIQKINKKRSQYITSHKTNSKDDELESVMINAIKKQAKRKNYNW